MAKKIRIGIIRCDLHAAYYGALMEKHDPLKFRSPRPLDYKHHYGWEVGMGYFYHYTYYGNPRKITVETVSGFEIVKVWDEHREAAEIFSELFCNKPVVCDTPDQVSDGVDLVFIADCEGEGQDHLELARPGLKKGVATFVDKPFAYIASDAKKMLALGEKNGAPVMSLSILRSLPAASQFAKRLPEIGGALLGSIFGGSTNLAGLIHTVALGQHIFGAGVQTVKRMDCERQAVIHMDYGERPDRPRQGVVITCYCPAPHCSMFASAYGPTGRIHSPHFDDYIFPFGAAENLKKIRKMVKTGKAPMPTDDMVEIVAVAEASRISVATGKAVKVADVIKGKLTEQKTKKRSAR